MCLLHAAGSPVREVFETEMSLLVFVGVKVEVGGEGLSWPFSFYHSCTNCFGESLMANCRDHVQINRLVL